MSTDLDVREMKPGILVTEEVNLVGGIHYDREDQDSYFDDKAQIKEWKTISRIDDVDERAEAQKLRSRIYQLVRNHCAKTPVGLICEESKRGVLLETIRGIKEERDAFNRKAKTCRIATCHACFDVKADNHETISAIMQQVASVAENVNSAITRDDEITLKQSARKWLKGMKPSSILLLPEKEKNAIVARVRAELIRRAIKDIKGVENLLPKEASQKTQELVSQSRLIAKRLCNKVERHNQALDEVLEEVDLSGIRKNRAAFVLAATKADKRTLDTSEKVSVVGARKLVNYT